MSPHPHPPGSRNEVVDDGDGLLGGHGLEPDVPRVPEVLEQVVLDVGAAIVLRRLPAEGAARLRDVDHHGLAGRGGGSWRKRKWRRIGRLILVYTIKCNLMFFATCLYFCSKLNSFPCQ